MFLRDYQGALRNCRKGWFLTHILGPAKSPGQEYSVAIKVTPHRSATEEVRAARFFFGRAWGYESSKASGEQTSVRDHDRGIRAFLALCEVEFTSGERVLLDHYCDFEMGALIGD